MIKARRNGDAIQILAFKKGGGDRKICRQQMWKEKESSGTRRMMWLVQVQKEDGWRQRGGNWATFESVFSNGCGFSFFFSLLVHEAGWQSSELCLQLQGSWLQRKFLLLITCLQDLF